MNILDDIVDSITGNIDQKKKIKLLDGVFTMEAEDPYIFSLSTTILMRLRTYCLQLTPKNRRAFISLKKYRITDIDPKYKQYENYTHVVIFCINFLNNDQFQPIASVAIKKKSSATQTKTLASLVCFFIDKLTKFNFHIYGTVSPATETFRAIFNYLATDKNECPLTYSVKDAGKMIHIYCIQDLISEFRNIMKEKDLRFRNGNEKTYLYSTYEDMHKTFDGMFTQLDPTTKNQILVQSKYGIPILIDTINTLDFLFKMEDIEVYKHIDLISSWDFLIKTIQSVQVKKRNKNTCTALVQADDNKLTIYDDDQLEIADEGFDLVINNFEKFFNEFFHVEEEISSDEVLANLYQLKTLNDKRSDVSEDEAENDDDEEWNKSPEEKRIINDLVVSLFGAREFLLKINGALNTVKSTIFCVDHIDYFINLLKKYNGELRDLEKFTQEDLVWNNTEYMIFDKFVANFIFKGDKGGAAYMAC